MCYNSPGKLIQEKTVPPLSWLLEALAFLDSCFPTLSSKPAMMGQVLMWHLSDLLLSCIYH